MLKAKWALIATMLMGAAPSALAADADQERFRDLYKALVETNTTLSSGDCTLAAERMAARLKAAGYPEKDVTVLVPEGKPKEGNLVAVLRGSDPRAKPMLLLAHIDVVEAKREDWTRDPFTLFEEGGYFYARGVSDDKAQAAIWVDTLVRYKEEGFRPRRDIKMALTCGEETVGAFNGAEYLATQRKDLIDAEFALNEGAGGRLDETGKPIALNIEAGQKLPQSFSLEVTNPGGHSARPTAKNAIVQLSTALAAIGGHRFPIRFTDASRGYFQEMAKITPGAAGQAMAALVANPADAQAGATVTADPGLNGMLRTTCIPTMLNAGHAENAQPQRATAVVNCRILPGESVEQVRATLQGLIVDPDVKLTAMRARSGEPKAAPTLGPSLTGPVKEVAAQIWPGVPLIPVLTTGATDGAFLNAAGIPTYGLTGIFVDPDGGGVHGLNERVRVKSVYDAREFLYRLVKRYAALG